jgi:hypothetical protein
MIECNDRRINVARQSLWKIEDKCGKDLGYVANVFGCGPKPLRSNFWSGRREPGFGMQSLPDCAKTKPTYCRQ